MTFAQTGIWLAPQIKFSLSLIGSFILNIRADHIPRKNAGGKNTDGSFPGLHADVDVVESSGSQRPPILSAGCSPALVVGLLYSPTASIHSGGTWTTTSSNRASITRSTRPDGGGSGFLTMAFFVMNVGSIND